jgi:hypothetical protein
VYVQAAEEAVAAGQQPLPPQRAIAAQARAYTGSSQLTMFSIVLKDRHVVFEQGQTKQCVQLEIWYCAELMQDLFQHKRVSVFGVYKSKWSGVWHIVCLLALVIFLFPRARSQSLCCWRMHCSQKGVVSAFLKCVGLARTT